MEWDCLSRTLIHIRCPETSIIIFKSIIHHSQLELSTTSNAESNQIHESNQHLGQNHYFIICTFQVCPYLALYSVFIIIAFDIYIANKMESKYSSCNVQVWYISKCSIQFFICTFQVTTPSCLLYILYELEINRKYKARWRCC